MFDIAGMQKQMKESKENWEKIDELVKKLEESLDININPDMKALLLLLVEQIRPAYSPEAMEDSMKGILDAFTGGQADDK